MLIKHFARPLSTLSRKTGRKATSGAARASASSSPSPPHPPPLQEPVAYPLRRSPKFRHVSCEVASSDLCQSLLQRLQPTLPAPNTCDLIDINPGSAVWSRHLHDVLRPRRHVLVEPRLQQFGQHLEPLLTSSNSTYRHAETLEAALDPANGHLSEYPLQHVEKPLAPNPSLLVTVNLSGPRSQTKTFVGSAGKKFMHDLIASHWARGSQLYRYGYVRVLAWIPAHEGNVYIPRSVVTRQKLSVMLEASMKLQLLCIPSLETSRYPTRDHPDPILEQQDFNRVETQDPLFASLPEPRRLLPPRPHLLTIEPTPTALRQSTFSTNAIWVLRFLELDQDLKQSDPEFYELTTQPALPFETLRAHAKMDPKRRDWFKYLATAKTTYKSRMHALALVEKHRKIDAALRSLPSAAGSHLREPLYKRLALLDHDVSTMTRTNRRWIEKLIDDYRVLDLDPPVLAWSHRDHQPLATHADEFCPESQSLALVDITPRPDFTTPFESEGQSLCFVHVMNLASEMMHKPVDQFLSQLVPGGLEEFLKTFPDIREPSKGGWHDLTALRTRTLPADMFVKLALAYHDWPFRVSTREMLLKSDDSLAPTQNSANHYRPQ
ncbi:hypothetical protein B0A52_00549 [Exophiala mesophila]|uniref:rRNA adenine N(6)-methyltransferase n=1 Tax=Exophiala mesophila TaxID=212818 RepID=A0A438NHJ1_EXOME|nr:hypothetical protein B0A52_00549 [Exophiala mesophila]